MDKSSQFLDGMAKRAVARSTWIRTDTLSRMDRAVLSKPARVVPLAPNELVQFFREVVKQGGRRTGVWKGPATVICSQSERDSLAPSKIFVAFQGRPWLCAPEGVRPISVEAKLAKKTLDENSALRAHVQQHGHLRMLDVRHEVRSIHRHAAEENDDLEERVPEGEELADLIGQVSQQPTEPTPAIPVAVRALPLPNQVEEAGEPDIDPDDDMNQHVDELVDEIFRRAD